MEYPDECTAQKGEGWGKESTAWGGKEAFAKFFGPRIPKEELQIQEKQSHQSEARGLETTEEWVKANTLIRLYIGV